MQIEKFGTNFVELIFAYAGRENLSVEFTFANWPKVFKNHEN